MRTLRVAVSLAFIVLVLTAVGFAQYPKIYQPRNVPGTKQPTGDSQSPADLQRDKGDTPEVVAITPKCLVTGKRGDVVLKLKGVLPSQVTNVKGYGQCQSATTFAQVPPDQIKLTFDVPVSSSNGSCDIQLQTSRRRTLYAHLCLNSPEEAKRREDAEKLERAGNAQANQYMNQMKAAQSVVGSKWVMTIGSQKDTYTVFHQSDDQGMNIHFKNTAGQEVQISHMGGQLQIVSKAGCMMMGKVAGTKADGQVVFGCGVPQGTKWSAVVTP